MIQDFLRDRRALLQAIDDYQGECNLSSYSYSLEEKLKITLQFSKSVKRSLTEDISMILNKYFSLVKYHWPDYQNLDTNVLLEKVLETETFSDLIFQKIVDESVTSNVIKQMIEQNQSKKERRRAKQAYEKLELWEIRNSNKSLYYIGVFSAIIFTDQKLIE